ncbi:MAG: ATP-binding protein, partial [Bacteroidetes bacterium]|nr:ATP-binding protein [Bacteroidota bacterium]
GQNITLEFPESTFNNFHVKADRQKLKQVLLNLINNAVKFNREGGEVKVACEAGSKEKGVGMNTVRISVIDTGKGIAPDEIQKLFNPFQRIGAEISEVEGTGLGLTVAKKLIEAMGGTIGVESEVGVGSTFWIELPRSEGQIDRHERNGDFVKPETASVVGGTLLYIEDNVSNIQLVEQILEVHRPGIRLITETYGRNAVKLATDYKPDLILLDLDLPDIHGSEVLTLLQAGLKTATIPVVVISADAMAKQIEKLLKTGAKDYLTKPLDVIEFLKVIDESIVDKA